MQARCVIGGVSVDLHCPGFFRKSNYKITWLCFPLVLETWKKVCTNVTRALGKRTSEVEFVVSDAAKEQFFQDQSFQETALLFGGGSKSLLTLAHLLDQNVSPYLISLWGDSWTGSDPEKNRERFDLEENICQDLQLRIVRIHTKLRAIFHKKNFKPSLRKKVYNIDAAFTLPISVSVVLPVTRQFHIGSIISGNEKEYSGCLQEYDYSSEMTRSLSSPGKYVNYYSKLEDLTKVRIIKELHQKHLHIAKYQYSCYSVFHQRWCLKCIKCLTNYLTYKIFDIDPASAGMDEAVMLRNLPDTILEAKRKYCKNKYHFRVWNRIGREAVM